MTSRFLNAVFEQAVCAAERGFTISYDFDNGRAVNRRVDLNGLVDATESCHDLFIVEDLEQAIHRLAAVPLVAGLDIVSQYLLRLLHRAFDDLLIGHVGLLDRKSQAELVFDAKMLIKELLQV